MIPKTGTVSWEKYGFDVAERCAVLQMGNTLISEKQDFCNF
jgi:hypothetical protein